MGFLDSVSATFNKSADAASRTAKTLKLRGQIAETTKRRQSLAAQLGASLYEFTKDDPAFRAGREEIYDGIAACDEERAACQAEIDEIEAAAAAASESARMIECTNCHARVAAGDRFCSGCGKPVEEIKEELHAAQESAENLSPEEAGAVCSSCGASVAADNLFCTSCGARIEPTQKAEILNVEPVEEASSLEAAGEDASRTSD